MNNHSVCNSIEAENNVLDIIVVGGGINGAGIAVDAAGRGLKVGLYEEKDFASATSSASSKLIHGGLRYLEHYEFRLVGESLAEREVLLRKAPHIAKPMRFRLPHRPFLRPAWMIRAGLFLYDHLGKRTSLPASKKIALNAGVVTKNEMKMGFEYSDCWVDDARLVILNAMQARELGSEVKNYCRVESARRVDELWHVTLFDEKTQTRFTRRSHALVNATGPWVKQFIDEQIEITSPYGIRLIKGSHIIVPKIHDEEQAYILQNEDKRIVFVIPYLDHYSMIGTTDVEYRGDPRQVKISVEEKQYLLDVVNKHFIHQVTLDDIVADFSGVRPLCDDESDSPQAITRDYTLSLDQQADNAPLLSIFGGKLTTYRKLSESAMGQLKPFFNQMSDSWTANKPLPGGEAFYPAQLKQQLEQRFPDLDKATINRWITNYGSRASVMLDNVQSSADLGKHFAFGLYQCEVDYLLHYEFASSCEDILWRRSKLGLTFNTEQIDQLNDYIDQSSTCECQRISA
ncbi:MULTISPECIES: glycerol-3-phosphate dehydrogenase [unclassified Vibrio]|uniref:glycerol-3-phosphate dehydrogenase n=1 Tax=unclassified Vibrio TaxID=2614977 RepID=UPI001482B9D6|nr:MULTISPECIES: glycerol-3-phosphate dehydrogenase [unclassified Vibrio]MDQ2192250.1 glycerol-3-phosphate dehydrogenase [Vibrio sp. A14(2019)]MDQ2196400.1 glycerol-3-phosphate dehydrogenase [Vibrio sp. 2017_1457_11]NNN75554.1 glycerol-3-phosphate dehydrogenase [Vibrio sp. B7]NNN92344.1 glycerol-3-phosphate dehydrogenase [Vibrio sp. B8-1]NNO07644.1 glycerol-3-phosphate dehydrogenase [Vibrio sp. B4-12]